MVLPENVPSNEGRLAVVRQYTAAFVGALSMLMIGMATAWPSPVLPLILNDAAPVTLNHVQISWVVSLMFFGNTLSPLPVGWLMDRLGRKRSLYVLNVMPFSAWVITYYGRTAWTLYAARFLNGLWAGTAYTVCAVYIGEIAEPAYRGSLSNFNNLLKTIGGLLVYIVGPYVSYESIALWCGVVPSLFFVAAAFIPESPYFLLMKGRREEAKQALTWLRGGKEETAVESEVTNIENAVIAQTKNKGSLRDFFVDVATRKAMIITIGLAIVKNMSGFDVMMAYTSVTLPPTAFESLGPNECVILLGVVSVASCFGSMFLLDRCPRKVLLTVSSLGCAIMTLLAGLWFYLDENTEIDVEAFAQLPFYCFAVHAVLYSIGLGPIVALLKGEMFSAHVKGFCSAITSILFALLTFIFTKIYLLVADSFGMYANYFIYTMGCMLGTVFIVLYLIETRGKTLNEIQVTLSQRNILHSTKF